MISTYNLRKINILYISSGNYWIRLRAIGPCNIERVEAFGILSYYDEDAVSNLELSYPQIPFPLYDNPFPPGIVSKVELNSKKQLYLHQMNTYSI